MAESIASNPNYLPADYASFIQGGLHEAGRLGFNLEQAVAANGLGSPDAAGREHLLTTAEQIAEQAELDAGFFDRVANIVLLAAVADSWGANEKRAATSNAREEQVVAERQALYDIVLIMAGMQSGVVRRLAESDPAASRKYVLTEANQDPDAFARETYLDGLNDEQAAAEVREVFAERGTGSFLHEARTMLGLDPASEVSFRIRVLKVASHGQELTRAGMFQPVTYPSWQGYDEAVEEEERHAIRAASMAASAETDRQDATAAPYINTAREYDAKFGEKFGPLAPAFVNHELDGSVVLTLAAPIAHTLINVRRGVVDPEGENGWILRPLLAAAEHEFKHTQRYMGVGPDAQIGLMLEERAAELVGRDRNGYLDIKHMFNLMTLATGHNLRERLSDALQHEDPLSVFMADAAQDLGLRTLMLLVAAKPSHYEVHPELADRFVDLRWLSKPGDASVLEAIVRDTIERHGGVEQFTANVRAWAARRAAEGVDLDTLAAGAAYMGRHGFSSLIPMEVNGIEGARATT